MDSKVKKDDSKKLANLIKVEPTKEVVNIVPKRIKTGGRVKGTPNVLTSELRETLKEFLSNEISNLSNQDVLSKLTLSERLVFITKILPYVLPKVEPIEGTYDEPVW
jgi:hypothetical protein